MALVAVVSLVAFLAIGFLNFNTLRAEVNDALDQALEQRWSIDSILLGPGDGNRPHMSSSVSCYCVTVLTDGTVIPLENQGVHMDESTLEASVELALSSDEMEGVISDYGLIYKVAQTGMGWRVAFADSTQVEAQAKSFAIGLVCAWIGLMLVMFLIVLFLSKFVTKPVEQAWEDQQRFIADASHELKTPLTVILADASILKNNPDKTVESQQAWVEGIAFEAERMQRLTEDMLALAQDDANPIGQLQERVDLSQLVERSVLQFEAVAFERGMVIEDDVEPGLFVTGDSSRLSGMVKTLLENACKYGSSKLRVSLRKVGNDAHLRVANDGDPIAPEDLPHVFDRFFKSDKSRARDGESMSFGLGLSIARSAAQLHGGDMSVASDERETVFRAVLPLSL